MTQIADIHEPAHNGLPNADAAPDDIDMALDRHGSRSALTFSTRRGPQERPLSGHQRFVADHLRIDYIAVPVLRGRCVAQYLQQFGTCLDRMMRHGSYILIAVCA